MHYIMSFAYYYPLFMAYVWMIGGVYYRFHWESINGDSYKEPPKLTEYPGVKYFIALF